MTEQGITFGPVPSRRLGRILGINNITTKKCSYSCIYCQAGRTAQVQIERRDFYQPEDIIQDVRGRLERAGKAIDYLTFVPDGEPTLDVNLGQAISQLQTLRIPVGVITNSSLLWREDVREELGKADWVSLKIDAVDQGVWHRINQPHPALRLSTILDGIRAFAQSFSGILVTETMLVRGVNDTRECMQEMADFLHALQPSRAYLSVPTRPPAERWVRWSRTARQPGRRNPQSDGMDLGEKNRPNGIFEWL